MQTESPSTSATSLMMSDAKVSFRIQQDSMSGEPTQALLTFHLLQMQANSPPGSVFALDLSGLRAPNITVWTAWHDEHIAAVGALKMLDNMHGEIKSMRTHPHYLRQGAAAALLEHIIAVANERGMMQLSLETGSGPAFDPALTLYRKRGFVEGAAFADYVPSAFNQFFHMAI